MKNLVILDRAVDEGYFCNEIAYLEIPGVEEYQQKQQRYSNFLPPLDDIEFNENQRREKLKNSFLLTLDSFVIKLTSSPEKRLA